MAKFLTFWGVSSGACGLAVAIAQVSGVEMFVDIGASGLFIQMLLGIGLGEIARVAAKPS